MNPLCVKIRIQLFAAAREIAGSDALELDVPQNATIRDVRDQLVVAVPLLKPLVNSLLWAVNNQYAGDDRAVSASDTIACFPPVSGG